MESNKAIYEFQERGEPATLARAVNRHARGVRQQRHAGDFGRVSFLADHVHNGLHGDEQGNQAGEQPGPGQKVTCARPAATATQLGPTAQRIGARIRPPNPSCLRSWASGVPELEAQADRHGSINDILASYVHGRL